MSARWLARASLLLVLAAAADMVGFADLSSVTMVGVGAAGACLVLVGGYVFSRTGGCCGGWRWAWWSSPRSRCW